MQKLQKIIQTIGRPIPVITAFLVFILIGGTNLENIARLEEQAGTKLLDTRLSYTGEEAVAILEQFGPEGRDAYKELLTGSELVFPVLYRGFMILLLAFLLKKWLGPENRWILLSLLPFADMILDYTENFLIFSMLTNYPDAVEGLTGVIGFVSSGKYFFVIAAVLLALISTIGTIINKIKNRIKQTA